MLPKAYELTKDVWMVPCSINPNTLHYKPLSLPSDQFIAPTKKITENAWKPAEDSIITQKVATNGPKNWSTIAKEINFTLYNSFQVRNGKKCRERWNNHLNPILNKSSWSAEEDQILITKQQEFGNKWSKISQFIPGRTESQTKNRWKSIKKTVIRRKSGKKSFQIAVLDACLPTKLDFHKKNRLSVINEDSPYSLEDINSGPSYCFECRKVEIEREETCEDFLMLRAMSPVEESFERLDGVDRKSSFVDNGLENDELRFGEYGDEFGLLWVSEHEGFESYFGEEI